MATKLISAGPDWLTATSSNNPTILDAECYFWQMREEYEIPMSVVRKGGFKGYTGHRMPHCFFGTREDGAIIVVSARLAYDYAMELIEVGMRPSRLDLQVTVEDDELHSTAVGSAFKAACSFQNPLGRPPNVKMWVDRKGPEGMSIGSRKSEVYLRCYDKEKESHSTDYKNCIRYECQFMSSTAQRIASSSKNFTSISNHSQSLVYSNFNSRGVKPIFDFKLDVEASRPPPIPTPVESKMQWLKTQVSPTVQTLMTDVEWAQIYEAVFHASLEELDDEDGL